MASAEPLPEQPWASGDALLEQYLETEGQSAADDMRACLLADAERVRRQVTGWAHRRRIIADRRAAIMAQAEAAIQEIAAWRDRETGRLDRQAGSLDLLLQGHHAAEVERDHRAKTIHLPWGITPRVRAQQPQWVRDEQALLEWAQAMAPEYVGQRPVLRWGEMRRAAAVTEDGRAVLPDGQVLPGVEVLRKAELWSVEAEQDPTTDTEVQ